MTGKRSCTSRRWLVLLGLILISMLFGGTIQPRTASVAAAGDFSRWLPLIAGQPEQSGEVPAFEHIFIIVLENTGYTALIEGDQAPFLQSLAQQYGISTEYYGVQHPSLPNYLALAGGDTFGIDRNCTDCQVDAPNIVDQLETAGYSWKAYMESMPAPCFVGNKGSLYQQKHNPFIYFNSIRDNPARCNKIVPFADFETDLQTSTVPDYVWITPNMCNNMHDCPIRTGDTWLQTWVTRILASPAWQERGVLFITFDEGELIDMSGCCQYAAGGHLATLVISPLGKPGYRSSTQYSHYSLLRTIEQAWGLPFLGKAGCTCSAPMAEFFDPALR